MNPIDRPYSPTFKFDEDFKITYQENLKVAMQIFKDKGSISVKDLVGMDIDLESSYDLMNEVFEKIKHFSNVHFTYVRCRNQNLVFQAQRDYVKR